MQRAREFIEFFDRLGTLDRVTVRLRCSHVSAELAALCERVREGGGTVAPNAPDAPNDAPDATGAILEVVDGPRESARLEAGPRLIVHVRAESAGPSVAPFAVLAVVVALAVVVLLAQNLRR